MLNTAGQQQLQFTTIRRTELYRNKIFQYIDDNKNDYMNLCSKDTS